jgi:hypothetical protein
MKGLVVRATNGGAMIRRAWLLFSIAWAVIVIVLQGVPERPDEASPMLWVIAAAPLAGGWLAVRALNFIRWGSFTRPRRSRASCG